MNITRQLSSQVGDRTQEANRIVAAQCLDNPALLDEVAQGLKGQDSALLGDCCEVLTKVAEKRPELCLPYIDIMIAMLSHKATRVRWEAMHTVALLTELIPEKNIVLLPRLVEIIQHDNSTIVRDYAVDALGNMAKANESAALLVYPVLKDALRSWGGKHLGRVLGWLCSVATSSPSLITEIQQLAHELKDHEKPSVRKAAKALIKAYDKIDLETQNARDKSHALYKQQ